MGYRIELFRYAKPHAGYDMLKRIVNFPGLKDYFIVTENVDGVINKTGIPPGKIWEIYGNMNNFQCQHGKIFSNEGYEMKVDGDLKWYGEFPKCNCEERTPPSPNRPSPRPPFSCLSWCRAPEYPAVQ